MVESPSAHAAEGNLPAACILPATPRVYSSDKNPLALATENLGYGTVARTIETSGTSMWLYSAVRQHMCK